MVEQLQSDNSVFIEECFDHIHRAMDPESKVLLISNEVESRQYKKRHKLKGYKVILIKKYE